ncbi:MAG: membrane-bound O-acyltransferase family protein [Marivirga sp.]|nr:membrane-bound O-acyltransferase family protein [Marivirga sp.]
MVFNSVDFAIFLPIVFILYWFVFKNLKWQNALIAISSYFFYGWWDWRFLFLLFFSTVLDYLVGLGLAKSTQEHKRKLLLLTSIIVNLGLLGFFKYYNFFVNSFIDAFSFFGQAISPNTLNIILPVGISFYTFQTLSYSIDVYRRQLEPTKDFISFAAFVTFFPQLVAGPIERATNLLPQFYTQRSFDKAKAVDGLRQILWGLFKKMVIADNCASYANTIFNDSSSYSGFTLLLGAIFFAFQIYCDFSGYSDIAIGTSRLFGFSLMQNFAFPYFSRDIGEFWRRWHISLSTWFRDYVYIPLGGSKGGMWMKIRNIFLIFLISGFWHGANWTFVIWGALNAIYYLPLLLRNKNRLNLDVVAEGRNFPSLRELSDIALTFSLTLFAWIFFRAESVSAAVDFISRMVAGFVNPASFIEAFDFMHNQVGMFRPIIFCLFFAVEWMGRGDKYAIQNLGLNWSRTPRWAFYYAIIVIIILYTGQQQGFIYFQF